jgi:hypothetical protein
MHLENLYYLAGIVSALAAVLGLFGLAYYASETRKLRVAAQDQVQNMLKPCVLLIRDHSSSRRFNQTPLIFKNLGTGAALNLRWHLAASETHAWQELPALAPTEICTSHLLIKDVLNGGGSVECEFESITGERYQTHSYYPDSTSDFDPRHTSKQIRERR